jgi:hypothetical protein
MVAAKSSNGMELRCLIGIMECRGELMYGRNATAQREDQEGEVVYER